MVRARRGRAMLPAGEHDFAELPVPWPQQGGGNLRRIIRLDLPRRLGRRLPRPVTEVLTGIVAAVALVGLRVALTPVVGEVAPFAFAFLAMVLATLVAGWRGGVVAILIGIGAGWYFVLAPVHGAALPAATFISLV